VSAQRDSSLLGCDEHGRTPDDCFDASSRRHRCRFRKQCPLWEAGFLFCPVIPFQWALHRRSARVGGGCLMLFETFPDGQTPPAPPLGPVLKRHDDPPGGPSHVRTRIPVSSRGETRMGLTGFRTLLAVLGTALFIGMAPALAISGCLGGTERINLGIAGIGISGLFLSFFFDGTGGGADGNTDGGNTGMSRKDYRLLLSTIGSAVLLGTFPAMMAIDLSGGSDLLIFGAACVGTVGFILLLLGET